MVDSADITAGILAGGQGQRLGGIDKGWFRFQSQPLVVWALSRLTNQCGTIIISANRNLAAYRNLGYPVVTDAGQPGAGPLAGIAAILAAADTPLVLIVPVDMPHLPRDLAPRLASALPPTDEFAIARTAQRSHPMPALLRISVADNLARARRAGVRSVREWQAGLTGTPIDWPIETDFANINTLDDAADLVERDID